MIRETVLNTALMAKLAGAGRAPRTIVSEEVREITLPSGNLGYPGSLATSAYPAAAREVAKRLAPARVAVFGVTDEEPSDD